MKTILALNADGTKTPLRLAVEDFVKDADSAFPTNANRKPTGLTGRQKLQLQLKLTQELGVLRDDLTQSEFLQFATMLHETGNDSALRQAMEDVEILGKTAGGKRGLDVSTLIGKYKIEENS